MHRAVVKTCMWVMKHIHGMHVAILRWLIKTVEEGIGMYGCGMLYILIDIK